MIPAIRRIPAIRTATRRQIRFRTRRPGNGRKEVPTVNQVIALLTLMFFMWIVAVYATVRAESCLTLLILPVAVVERAAATGVPLYLLKDGSRTRCENIDVRNASRRRNPSEDSPGEPDQRQDSVSGISVEASVRRRF